MKRATSLLLEALLGIALISGQVRGQAPDRPVVFRVEVVSRTAKAINFHHRQGSTLVGLEGTSLAPKGKGEVKVDSKTGATKIDALVDHMPPAASIADGYLTYVMWAVTPEGRTENIGEVFLDGAHARLQASTELQTFGLIVTAEPYYAVTQPSDYVVLEGVVKTGGETSTTGTIMPIDAKYELVSRGNYLMQIPPAERTALREAKNIPLDLLEARQAMAIARAAGGSRYAAETVQKANVDLYNAESMFKSGQDRKKVQSLARHVTQLAEDARLISIRKASEEALGAERATAERRTTELTQTAENEAERRRRAELDAADQSRAAVEARRQAEQVQAQASAALATKDRELAEQADRSRLAAAQAEEARVKQQNLESEIARTKALAEQDKDQATSRLRQLEAEAIAARAAAEAANREREQSALKQRELDAEVTRARETAAAASQKQAEYEQMAAKARQAAEQAEADRIRTKAELVRQLNVILMTRESARGLIVNMSDVLFDTGRYTLKPGAREKLAKIAGIVLAHPGLKLEVEGHTDSTGGLTLNERLSEQRATAVRDFLVAQGIASQSIEARGFGPSKPVADNATAAGRQANRRVELVVSGELLSGSRGLPSNAVR